MHDKKYYKKLNEIIALDYIFVPLTDRSVRPV